MVKKGEIFYTSWGYDQTNYDYIVVLEISPSGKTAMCQRALHENVGFSCGANKQKPIPKGFGDKFRMQIKKAMIMGGDYLRGSYPFCHDGSMRHKRLDSFFKATEGEIFQETDSQWGH